MTTIRVLVLFSGTKSVTRSLSKYHPDKEFDIVTVDVDGRHSPTHHVDILKWDYRSLYPPDHFQYVWASPPCTEYSTAKRTGTRRLDLANSLVRKALEIINYFKPRVFWIENPATGLLCQSIRPHEKQTLLDHLDFVDVDYCKFSVQNDEFPYRKRTRIWSNGLKGFTPRLCSRANPCAMMDGNRHMRDICGRSREWNGNQITVDFKHRVPLLLIHELWSAVSNF